MKAFKKFYLIAAGAALGLALLGGDVQAKQKSRASTQQGDVDYNATPNSPTLPLVQYPPPQNYPTSVQIGTPSYYYYYPPTYGPGYGGGYGGAYGAPYGAGVSFYNSGGPTQRTFYYNTPIPGQVNIGGGGWGGGAFGGYGGYNGGLFVP